MGNTKLKYNNKVNQKVKIYYKNVKVIGKVDSQITK